MFNNFLAKIMPLMRKCGKMLYSHICNRRRYSACALHVGYQRLL